MNSNLIWITLGIVVIGLYLRALTKTTIIEYYPPGSDSVVRCKLASRSRSDYDTGDVLTMKLYEGSTFLGVYKNLMPIPANVKSFNLEYGSGCWYLRDSFGNPYVLGTHQIGMSN